MSLRRVLGVMAGQRRWIAAGALLGFLAIGSNIALMAMSAYLISRAAVVTSVAELALAITAVRVLAIARAAFRYLERYATHMATLRILTDLRVWFYRAIEPLAPAGLDAYRSGDLLARIVADIDTLEDVHARVLVPPIVATASIAFASLLLGAFDPVLGIVLLAFLLLTGVVLPVISRRLSRAAATELVADRAEVHAAFVDGVRGLAELVAFDAAAGHQARSLALGDAFDATQARLARVRGATGGLLALSTSLAGVAMLAVGIELVDAGRLDGVYLAVLPLAAIAAFEAVQPLTLSVQLLDQTRAAADRLTELIDAPPAVVDPVEPVPPPALAPVLVPATGPASIPTAAAATPGGAAFALMRTAPAIDVRGLRFAYTPDGPPVLDGLELSIPAGGSLALLGPSGAGKSTLVDLLVRFREPGAGEIHLDGVDIRRHRADDVRACFGVVSQRTHLFNGTIRDNLALADADVTDEGVETACRLAQLDAFVRSLPDGYETRIGEDAVLLSGGERQRLAIARVIVRGAPVVVFDEATSDLDALTEARLMDALEPFLAARTTLLVTHRRSLAARADTTLVLEGGRARPTAVRPAKMPPNPPGGAR